MPASTVSKYVAVGLERLRRALAEVGYDAVPAAIAGSLTHTAPQAPATLAAALRGLAAGKSAAEAGTFAGAGQGAIEGGTGESGGGAGGAAGSALGGSWGLAGPAWF